MGSFSVSCGMSSLPIHSGDKVGLVLLSPNQHPAKGPCSTYIHADDLNKPFMPPIYGEYDDYGGLENIVVDKNTAILERFFELSIQEIIGFVTRGGEFYSESLIFHSLFKKGSNATGKKRSVESDLLGVGFTKDKDGKFAFGDYLVEVIVEMRTINSYEYEATDYSMVNTKTGHNYGTLRHMDSTYRFLEYFARETKLYPGYDEDRFEKFTILGSLSGMFLISEVFQGMIPAMSKEYYYDTPLSEEWSTLRQAMLGHKDKIKDLDERLTEFAELELASVMFNNRAYRYIDRYVGFPTDHIGHFVRESETIVDEFEALIAIMHSVNRLFQPTFCGEQEGNLVASRKLAELSLKIIDDKMKRFS